MSDAASGTVRLAMWSGPRNISTAMMRSFENRPDTEVVDEPFYAAYLAATGLEHPMRAEVLASQPTDWRAVVRSLSGSGPLGAPVFYQKHMTHHMLPEIDTDWTAGCRNMFLIRDPARVLASYVEKRETVALEDIGVVRQRELFDREADRLGHAPPVVDSSDVLRDPAGTLGRLCAVIGLPFRAEMLSWPSGTRASDGVWAPAWYDQVERSTGFKARREGDPPQLPPHLQRVADAAAADYSALARWKLAPVVGDVTADTGV